ncbi:MAG TPA: arginine--tRNA ligase [Clostridiaceae bacterium]
MDYKRFIAEKIREKVDIDIETIEKYIEIPPRQEMGDFAFPCFQLSKVMRKSPNMIAEDLKNSMNKAGLEKVENAGPYLNFYISKIDFIKATLEKIFKEKDQYGATNLGEGKNIVVEFSSPNIAKPFHIGHLSTTVIGNSLYKILSFEGYNCVRVNHLGDWGTQFGKLIAGYERWVDLEKLEEAPIDELLRIYVKFHEEAEKDTSLNDEARLHFKNLEDGCEMEVALWTKFKELSLKEFRKIYELLGVEFDSYAGESFYGDKMDAVIKDLEDKGLLVESNGAKVVMLEEYNMPPCIIIKSDGATIYATRDLAAAMYRKKTYDFYKNIYVVGTSQELHFKQVFTTLKLLGYDWAQDCKHVGFGLVKFPDRKLSTRKGDVVLLNDLLKEAMDKTLEIINEKNPDLEDKETVARKVGIGAMIFTYLKNYRERDIIFDWKEMLSFDGETGPYVQYTYARGKSILRRINVLEDEVNYTLLSSTEEFELAKELQGFDTAIIAAVDKLEPSFVTRHIISVAKSFNKFYNLHSILNAGDDKLLQARAKLVEATCQVISNGLKLLGIEVVEKM